MKKYRSIPIIISASLLLSGFSFFKGKTPSCNDRQAKQVLAEIIQEDIETSTGVANFWRKNIKQISPSIQDVVTNEHNKKLDIYWCGAEITIEANETLIEQYLAQQKRERIAEYDEQFKQNRKSLQEKLADLEEREKVLPHLYNEKLSNEKNILIGKINKLEQSISELKIDYQARLDRSNIELNKSRQNRLEIGNGKLDDNAKQSLKREKEWRESSLKDYFDTYIQPKIKELEHFKDESQNLPEKFRQAQEKEQQGIQNQKDHLLAEETRLKEKLEQDKQRIDEQLAQQKTEIQQGLVFPIGYKIQSFEDSDEFYVEIF